MSSVSGLNAQLTALGLVISPGTSLAAEVEQVSEDIASGSPSLAGDSDHLARDIYAAVDNGATFDPNKMLVDLAQDDGQSNSAPATQAQSLADLFQLYCRQNNIPFTGSDFNQAWSTFTQAIPGSISSTVLSAAMTDAQSEFGTTGDLNQAAILADQSYMEYQIALKDPNGNLSAGDKQRIADTAFAQMQRAFEMASNQGYNMAQFQDLLNSNMGAAYSSVRGLALGGTRLEGTNYTLSSDLSGVTAASTEQSLDAWLGSQTDLASSTEAAVARYEPETLNLGANFGSGFSGWLAEAQQYDQGNDPFANTPSGPTVPSAPTSSLISAISSEVTAIGPPSSLSTMHDYEIYEREARKALHNIANFANAIISGMNASPPTVSEADGASDISALEQQASTLEGWLSTAQTQIDDSGLAGQNSPLYTKIADAIGDDDSAAAGDLAGNFNDPSRYR